MFDLHSHSLLSDGELLPSELARRYEEKGFKAIAITDHVDISNIRAVVESITEFCKGWPKNRIRVIPGIELTHLPLDQYKKVAAYARNHGIKIIIAHGETIVEPVLAGSNRAALEADIDILAHPGLIKEADVRLAAKRGVLLEISSRKGHCLGNGHVAQLALKYDAKLCINSDSHTPFDIPTQNFFKLVGFGAGIPLDFMNRIEKDMAKLVNLK